jgi:alpha-tubulin suppressor-like RCC1 family protein
LKFWSKVLKSINNGMHRLVAALIASIFALSACSTPPLQNTPLLITEVTKLEILSGQAPLSQAMTDQVYTYKLDAAEADKAAWSWGDGSADASGAVVKKVWRQPGTFAVKVAATVKGKVISTSRSVTVVGAPISSGTMTTCAVTKSSRVHCWGESNYGFEAYTDFERGVNHVLIKDLADVVSVSRGPSRSCAVKSDRTAACWGHILTDNPNVAPDAYYSERRLPHTVVGLTDVIAIGTAALHTCALTAKGTVECWGDNKFGQLGDGTGKRSYKKPVPVAGVSDAVAVSVGGFHGCALRATGVVMCWGWNAFGQLGDGSSTDKLKPVQVVGLSDAVAVSVGTYASCALKASGNVVCWGGNQDGQLGDGTRNSKSIPTSVVGVTDAVAISVGDLHVCAVKSNAEVSCWGGNRYGQLGDGSVILKASATAVLGLSDVAAISAGHNRTCALQSSGQASCWGYNKGEALGGKTNGSDHQTTPIPVVGAGLL